jgi:hypothetical protein
MSFAQQMCVVNVMNELILYQSGVFVGVVPPIVDRDLNAARRIKLESC